MYKRNSLKRTTKTFKFVVLLITLIIGRGWLEHVWSESQAVWCRNMKWAMVFPTSNAPWIVVAVFLCVPVRLTCVTPKWAFGRVWLFNYYFCVKKKSKFVYVRVFDGFSNVNEKSGTCDLSENRFTLCTWVTRCPKFESATMVFMWRSRVDITNDNRDGRLTFSWWLWKLVSISIEWVKSKL